MRYLLRALIRLVFNLIARVDVSGYEHLPSAGNFVIATNHLGIVDAPLAFYALDRWDLFVLVAEKWEKNPFFRYEYFLHFRYLWRFLTAFPLYNLLVSAGFGSNRVSKMLVTIHNLPDSCSGHVS